jgi:predicted dehydrogenase
MTEQHPLTDEVIEEIAWFDPDAADMRAAADWQLEQVITAWEQCLESPRIDIQDLLDFGQKLKAMRPTTTQEDNS